LQYNAGDRAQSSVTPYCRFVAVALFYVLAWRNALQNACRWRHGHTDEHPATTS